MKKIGCEHNILRTITYPDSIVRNQVQTTIVDGEVIELICPENCEPITIYVKSKPQDSRTCL